MRRVAVSTWKILRLDDETVHCVGRVCTAAFSKVHNRLDTLAFDTAFSERSFLQTCPVFWS